MYKSILTASLFLSLLANSTTTATAQVTLQYWDNNGTSTPSGGIVDTNTANWAPSANLTAGTVAFTNGSYAAFVAGTTALGTITMTNNETNIGLSGLANGGFTNGICTNLTFVGTGSFYLEPGTNQIYIGSGANTYFWVPLNGPGGIIENGSGYLYLYGTNTYSGGTVITGGQLLYYSNNASFGTGPITFNGTQSILNSASGVVTLTNAWIVSNADGVLNFASGNTICSGPWTLESSVQIKDNSAANPLTISGPISGAFGIQFQNDNATAVGNGTITLSGSNTYTGQTWIGGGAAGGITTLSVTSINSVANPPQQPSSSLGVPSSVATGTINIGNAPSANSCALIYTGPGETSDRVINLTSTTTTEYIVMNGTGPLVLTGGITATTNGAKTLILEGTSTATNTISGPIVNSASGATTIVKAQAGTWVLSGTNTYTGGTTVSNGNLTVYSIADSGTSAIGNSGTLTLNTNNGDAAGVPIFTYAGTTAATTGRSVVLNGSTTTLTGINLSGQTLTLSGVVSGNGTPEVTNGTLILTGNNTYAGRTQVDSGATFEVGGAGKLGSGSYNHTCTVNGTGTFIYDSTSAQTNTGNFTGSGGFIQEGTGAVTLSATSTLTGPVTIGSGSTLIISTNNAVPDYFPSANYAGNFTNNGTFNFGISNAETISGPFTGTGSVTVSGSGALTLGDSSYTGATTIAAGSTLILNGTSTFASTTSLSIGAGGLLDVSALGLATLNVNTTSLTASGSTTNAATINGAASSTVNLGSQPMLLTFAPTTFTGDSSHPALNLPNSSLTLGGGNVITVNNAGSSPLGAGTYTLIQVGGGMTTGTPSPYVAVTGNGIAAGLYASVQVVGGNVVLVVTTPANSSPTWNGNDYANSPNWSDSTNWASGVPDATGDLVFFDNVSGSQTPVMDSSYTVFGLTFEGGCLPDVLTASGANVLTVGSGVTNASGSLQTIAMPVQLIDLGSQTVPSQWNTSGGNITASGVISDNNIGLAVSGGGTLSLTASNTYSGATTINGATLGANTIADAPCSIGTGALIFTNGGSLAFTGGSGTTSRAVSVEGSTTDTINLPSGNTLTLNGEVHAVSDTAAQTLALTGGGTLYLGGTLDNSSLTMAINQGEVVITKTSTSTVHGLGGGTSTVGAGNEGNSAELQLAGSGNYDLYNSCVLTVNGIDGFVDLNGQSDSFGALTLSGAGPSGNGVLINSSGTASSITNSGGVVLAGNTTIGGPGNIRLASAVSGAGMSLTYAGTGTLTLGAQGTYTGGTTINAGGTLQLVTGSPTNSSAGTGLITLNGNAVLDLSMTNTQMNNVIQGGSTSVINLAMGNGNLWLSNSPAAQLNSFSGTFNVTTTAANGGQLVIGTSTLAETINPSATWQINAGAVVDFNVNQINPATVYLNGNVVTGQNDGLLRLDASVQSGPVMLMANSSIGNGNAGASTVSGPISGNFGWTKAGANPLVLTGTNAYTGFTTISNGSLTIGGSGSLGSGTYAASITNLGTFIYNSSVNQTLSGVISGSGALTAEGPAPIILTAADTYTGATTITAGGTLSLSGSGAISNTPSITIAAGGTFDVSQLTAVRFFLSSSTALNASGTGTAQGSTAATINGQSTINLGSQPIGLTFTPTATNGDLVHPALYVSQGALALNGNAITVNNAGGSPLGVGTYTLVSVAGGSISGTTPTVTVTGSGLAAGLSASIQVSGGSLNMVVAAAIPPMPVINSFVKLGGNFIFSGTNGSANGTYYVLTSTNVALPTTNWTSIATNTFSPTGAFSVTNALGTNQSQFFIIEIP